MKKFIPNFAIWLVVSWMFPLPAQWRLASGTEGIFISDVEIYYSNPDTLYALGNGLMLSTDRGEHWNSVEVVYGGGVIKIDPFDSRQLYLSHNVLPFYGNQVFMTTDGGLNWFFLFSGICQPSIGCDLPIIEIDPGDLNTVYLDVNFMRLYRSTDRGATWDSIPPPSGLGLSSLAIAPSHNNILYAGYSTITEIYKSIDRGQTWQQLPFPIFQVYSPVFLAVHSQNPAIVYAAVFSSGGFPGGVYKTTDGGLTWEEKNNGLTSQDWDINTIAINPENPEELFIGNIGEINLFRTIDSGENWLRFDTGLPNTGGVNSIVIDTLNNRIYIGRSSGVYIYDGLTGVVQHNLEPSKVFILSQNYPNPFNSTTVIPYDLPDRAHVNLTVYDALGRGVINLVNSYQPAGRYRVEFNASGLPGGFYFYCLWVSSLSKRAGTNFFVRKALLVK